MVISEQKITVRFLGVLCYLTASLYLIEQFFSQQWLVLVYSLLGAILLISAIISISRINQIVVSFLIIIGSILFYFENIPFNDAVRGFGQNINLLSLFLLIPLIGTFMSVAGYLTALNEKVKERESHGGKHPYRLSYVLVTSIGTLLNFGAMAIVKRMADESFSSFQEKKLTLHIMRAFAFCMLWSPYFVNIGLVQVLFDVSWFDIGGFGFMLAIIYLGISLLMFPKINFPEDPLIERNKTHAKAIGRSSSLMPLVNFSIVLIFLSFLLDFVLNVNMLTVVSFLAVVLPIVWAIFSRLLKTYIQAVSDQIQGSFSRLKNELAIFISAGYFGLALSYTELGLNISNFLFHFTFGSVYLFSLSIIIIAVIFAQIGIHPIIIVVGIGSALSPATFGVSPEYIALTLLLAWTMATQLSPFSGQLLMASKLMKSSTTTITKQNVPFVLTCMCVLPVVLYGFYWLGWV